MQIKVGKQATRTVYPDIEGNLDLPEAERFGIVLEKPSQSRLNEVATEYVTDEGGAVRQKVNLSAITRSYIKRLVNAPEVDFEGGDTRTLKVSDLFSYDTFDETMKAIDRAIGEMRTEGTDTKN
jgi:hypothetical protein